MNDPQTLLRQEMKGTLLIDRLLQLKVGFQISMRLLFLQSVSSRQEELLCQPTQVVPSHM